MPTALIVEDEPEANKLLGMLIKLRGYRSTSALTGGEALDLLTKVSPDVIFLDLMLPDLSGYEVCRSVKGAVSTCLIPVVVVSARVAQNNRLECYRTGADDFVPKPYTPDQIFETLKRAEHLREESAADVIQGEVRFTAPEDDAAARELARLRSLILGRTPLAPNEAAAIIEILERAEAEFLNGSPHLPDAPTTVLRYELTREALRLTWEGPASATGGPLATDWTQSIDVSIHHDANRLTLVKRWA